MDDAKALLAAEHTLLLRKLCQNWAPELQSVPWQVLERAIFDVAINGEFDDLPKFSGIMVVDPETRGSYHTNSQALRHQISDPSSVGLSTADAMIAGMLARQMFAIHRDAALLFAEKRTIAEPSWWVQTPPTTAREPNVSPSALSNFLKKTADGTMTEEQLKTIASEYFADRSIPRTIWRSALAQLSDSQKRPRGKPAA
jgi:hypothetical protein